MAHVYMYMCVCMYVCSMFVGVDVVSLVCYIVGTNGLFVTPVECVPVRCTYVDTYVLTKLTLCLSSSWRRSQEVPALWGACP